MDLVFVHKVFGDISIQQLTILTAEGLRNKISQFHILEIKEQWSVCISNHYIYFIRPSQKTVQKVECCSIGKQQNIHHIMKDYFKADHCSKCTPLQKYLSTKEIYLHS